MTPPHASTAEADLYAPALAQLHALSPGALDRLASAWLSRRGCTGTHRCETQDPTSTTYHSGVPKLVVPFSLRLRIHQRRSRLQVHHVEAFAGHLLRTGISHGILVTTGAITPQARVLADSFRLVRLRLLSGPEWAAELAAWHLGLQRRPFWHWVLSQPLTLCNRPAPSQRQETR